VVIKILLADDHKMVRDELRSLIAELPVMTVIAEAEDGRSAVELAARLAPDILIMDISMPGINGVEATRRIVEESAASRIIALSMHTEKRVVLEMMNAGASGYILKDGAYEEIIGAILTVAAGGVYLSSRIAEIVPNDYAHRIPNRIIGPRHA
jgi:DNA-binding NarL/FixJ family response regulator